MPPKATPTTTTSSQPQNLENTSIENISSKDSQIVTIRQLKEIVTQIQENWNALSNKLQKIGMQKIKISTIKHFNKTRSKLKEFLTQIRLKLQNKKTKFIMPGDTIAYTKLFLTRRALKWFKPYLTKYQNNRVIITHLKTRFIFTKSDTFTEKLTQMYGNPNQKAIVKQQLKVLIQKPSAMGYTVQF